MAAGWRVAQVARIMRGREGRQTFAGPSRHLRRAAAGRCAVGGCGADCVGVDRVGLHRGRRGRVLRPEQRQSGGAWLLAWQRARRWGRSDQWAGSACELSRAGGRPCGPAAVRCKSRGASLGRRGHRVDLGRSCTAAVAVSRLLRQSERRWRVRERLGSPGVRPSRLAPPSSDAFGLPKTVRRSEPAIRMPDRLSAGRVLRPATALPLEGPRDHVVALAGAGAEGDMSHHDRPSGSSSVERASRVDHAFAY